MATTIKLKNGSGAPLAGDLVQGEPALDLTNKRLYTEDSGGTVIEVGTNPSTLTVDTDTLVVDAANNRVGIGASSPSTKLHVTGDTANYGILAEQPSGYGGLSIKSNTVAQTWSFIANDNGSNSDLLLYGGSSAGTKLVVDSSGNVGYTGKLFSSNSLTSASGLQLYRDHATGSCYLYDTTAAPYSGPLIFGTNNAERMRIDSSGNVMIKNTTGASFTLNAATDLSIGSGSANAGMTIYTGSSNQGAISFADGTTGDQQYRGYIVYTHSTDVMNFGTAGTERMRIDSSGNVLVGTTDGAFINGGGIKIANATAARLKLCDSNSAGTGSADGFELTQSGTAAYIYQNENDFMAFGTNATERMRIDSSGNLLVGRTSLHSGANANCELHVNNFIACSGYASKAGSGGAFSTNVFNFQWTGSPVLWVDSTNLGTISVSSDYRIKKDVKTTDKPALKRIARIRPVTYELDDYKELVKADGVQREGFIAHELQEVIPSAVEGEKDTEDQIQSLRLDALCSVLTKAIQEQQAMIEELKAEVAALKGA